MTYEKFGREFHEKLAQQNVAFTRDMREAERRVARGEYAIYLPWLAELPALAQGPAGQGRDSRKKASCICPTRRRS